MPNLDPRIEASLREALDALASQGTLIPVDRIQSSFAAFRERFGPAKLRSIDGEALLQVMHTHGNKESLVYWLEFKNDDEFPGNSFGGIGGGSAHKFGLFRRKETGLWVAGSAQNNRTVSEEEAVAIARKHRDQLLAGVALLEVLSANATDEEYLKLQADLKRVAPDICELAWAHKYFSLLFPEKLDDFHSLRWQRYNLIKLLQLPPGEGLYASAGRFVSAAKEMGWPMNHFTAALSERNGPPVHYWRIGTKIGEQSIWTSMRDGGYVAIGWADLGDLTPLLSEKDAKDMILSKVRPKYYPDNASMASRKAGEIRNFAQRVEIGDVVLASDGLHVLGLGRVTGDYRFDVTSPQDAPHRRPVDWISLKDWKLPESEGIQTSVFPIGKYETNLLEVEKNLLDAHKPSIVATTVSEPRVAVNSVTKIIQLEGIPGRIQGILERKNQVIIYGPPGTGKTHWARRTALDLAAVGSFGRLFLTLSPSEKEEIEGTAQTSGIVRGCTFHPAYGYEDFIEGYRPQLGGAGQLVFTQKEGLFKALCRDASRSKDRKFFLLIDEINRGDIPRIFGELVTLLEKDKRGIEVSLPVSGERFAVPPNVYVIGTMNTADRSIALLDAALRRRFGFVELMPDMTVFAGASVGGVPIGPWLAALNERIRTHCGRDARNLQIGHAYFMEGGRAVTTFQRFARIIAEDVVPLLEEYCYEDYGALKNILGDGLVDESIQRIREELFTSGQQEKLVQALLAISPEIATTLEAASQAELPTNEDDDDEDGENEK